MGAPHFRVGEPTGRSLDAANQGIAPEGREPVALPPFELRALRIANVGWGAGWKLEPAPMRRGWMDAQPYAYQCPPLAVANQWGWQILCPTDLLVAWDGTPDPAGVRVRIDPRYSAAIKSQFGQGIVTFGPPWLFRTPPGWNLHAKGPSNHWKPNCVALEGVVETWWLPYTFTLNWKIVSPGIVGFARGEPLGQLVPVPHATFQQATVVESPITSDPEAEAGLLRWQAERQRRANEKVTTHHLYRKAEGVADHIVRVGVPTVEHKGWDKPPPPAP
jgi:hypothetical protein